MGAPNVRSFFITNSKGKLREVVSDSLAGFCSQVPVIFVDTHFRGKELLDSWLHEGTHAECEDLPEKRVIQISEFLAEYLWKAGYRQVPKKKRKRRKQGH